MKFLASSALPSSGTGPQCESTRQLINDTTQPKYEFMTEFRVQRKKNIKSKKKSSKKSKNGSLKFAKKRIIYTKEGCPHKKRKSSAFRGVYSQKCKRKSCIQDADSIPNPAYQRQTAYQSLHPTYRDSAYQVQTAYQNLHSAYQSF